MCVLCGAHTETVLTHIHTHHTHTTHTVTTQKRTRKVERTRNNKKLVSRQSKKKKKKKMARYGITQGNYMAGAEFTGGDLEELKKKNDFGTCIFFFFSS